MLGVILQSCEHLCCVMGGQGAASGTEKADTELWYRSSLEVLLQSLGNFKTVQLQGLAAMAVYEKVGQIEWPVLLQGLPCQY